MAPPSTSPSATAHQPLRSRRAIRRITTTTTTATTVSTTVSPWAIPNAAPGLRTSRSVQHSPEQADRLAVAELANGQQLGRADRAPGRRPRRPAARSNRAAGPSVAGPSAAAPSESGSLSDAPPAACMSCTASPAGTPAVGPCRSGCHSSHRCRRCRCRCGPSARSACTSMSRVLLAKDISCSRSNVLLPASAGSSPAPSPAVAQHVVDLVLGQVELVTQPADLVLELGADLVELPWSTGPRRRGRPVRAGRASTSSAGGLAGAGRFGLGLGGLTGTPSARGLAAAASPGGGLLGADCAAGRRPRPSRRAFVAAAFWPAPSSAVALVAAAFVAAASSWPGPSWRSPSWPGPSWPAPSWRRAFLAAAFLAGAFLAGAFLAGAPSWRGLLGGGLLRRRLLGRRAFFAVAFFAGAPSWPASPSWRRPSSPAPSWPAAFFRRLLRRRLLGRGHLLRRWPSSPAPSSPAPPSWRWPSSPGPSSRATPWRVPSSRRPSSRRPSAAISVLEAAFVPGGLPRPGRGSADRSGCAADCCARGRDGVPHPPAAACGGARALVRHLRPLYLARPRSWWRPRRCPLATSVSAVATTIIAANGLRKDRSPQVRRQMGTPGRGPPVSPARFIRQLGREGRRQPAVARRARVEAVRRGQAGQVVDRGTGRPAGRPRRRPPGVRLR